MLGNHQQINESTDNMLEMTPSDFFSINRFLFDALQEIDKPNMDFLCNKLQFNKSKFRNYLIQFKVPTRIPKLKSLAQNIELKKEPPVYKLLSNFIRSGDFFKLDSRFIEFALPFNQFHFDYYHLLYNNSSFPITMMKNLPIGFDFSIISLDYRNT